MNISIAIVVSVVAIVAAIISILAALFVVVRQRQQSSVMIERERLLSKSIEILKKAEDISDPSKRSTEIESARKYLSGVPTIVQGDLTGSLVIGNENIVTNIQGISEGKFNRAESDRYRDLGRAKVQQWGERLNRENYWDWDLLGHAIDYYVDAIRRDPKNQHPWTNLAYVLHLVGEEKKAHQCLAESYKLATPGPNHPGNNYKQVRRAVDNDEYLTGGGKVDRPPVPGWFWEKHGRLPIH